MYLKWFSRISSIGLVTATLILNGIVHAATLSGVVFEDVNGNGSRDASEPGITNVRVSNGVDVVLTDQNGAYEVEVEGDVVVFVVKPTGYATPLNESNLPQFYYVHRPEGSPLAFRYPGISSTGQLPDSWDFPLLKEEVEERYEAILFADPQPQTEIELEYIRDDVIAELIGTWAKFGITLGDIMFDDLALFDRYNRLVGTIGIPWYNVPGNHELNFEAESDETSLETFTRHYGPRYYSFEYGNVVFFVLDNVIYEGATEPTSDNVMGRGSYRGGLDADQLQWFANELKHIPTSKLIFLSMHVPLNSPSGDAPGIHTGNGGELLKMLDDYPHVYSVAGHMHSSQHVYLNSDNEVDLEGRFHHHVLTTVSGSWWSGPMDERGIPVSIQSDGNPNGYHILSIDDVTPSVRFKGAGESPDLQMRITLDSVFHSSDYNSLRDFRTGELFGGRISAAHTPSTRILVNVFDGGPKTTVKYRIDDGEAKSMSKVEEPDPHFVELQNRFSASMKSWVQAFPSQHLWSAALDELAPGTYVLHVEAVDEFSNTHRASKVLEIVWK